MAITLNNQNFEKETQSQLVLVDFWANWCQPCKMLDPILADLEDQFSTQIKFAKVDIEKNMELAEKFHIQNIPAQILFVNSQAKEKVTGYKPKKQFEGYLSQKIVEYKEENTNE